MCQAHRISHAQILTVTSSAKTQALVLSLAQLLADVTSANHERYQASSEFEPSTQMFNNNINNTTTSPTTSSPPSTSTAAYLSWSVEQLLWHVVTNIRCSNACLVLAFFYMDSIVERDPSMQITRRNVHKLLISCLLVAIKFLDDENLRNSNFAITVGMPVEELNRLEREVLRRLQFQLNISEANFEYYHDLILQWSSTNDSSSTNDDKYEYESSINAVNTNMNTLNLNSSISTNTTRSSSDCIKSNGSNHHHVHQDLGMPTKKHLQQ